jgi:tetratricopeptide (TPR) repeat protein
MSRSKLARLKGPAALLVVGVLAAVTTAAHPALRARAFAPMDSCTEVPVRDTMSAVWRGIWTQYGRIEAAVRQKDTATLRSLISPEYHAVEPNGEVWSHERTVAYQLNGLMAVYETHEISNSILILTACGDRATATVLQQWYRTQALQSGGPLYRVETNAVQDEHWIRYPDGWKHGLVENVHGGARFIDGRRANIGIGSPPYDPEAPPYDPHDPHPKRSAVDTLLSIITGRGIDAGLRAIPTLERSPDYLVSRVQLNLLGYRLLALKRVPEAIEIFKLNVATYPYSADAYDSLGEAYMTLGDRDAAIRSYVRSLELNPRNENAAAMLRKVRSGP